MAARLTYVTGTPGTGVEKSLLKFVEWRGAVDGTSGDRAGHIVKLEDHLRKLAAGDVRECLKLDLAVGRPARLYDVLRLPKPVLADRWREAFDASVAEARQYLDRGIDTFVTFHACWYHLGNREFVSGIDFKRLFDSGHQADKVITFIDDIYDIRSRLSGYEGPGVLHAAWSAYSQLVDIVLKLLLILDWRAFEIGLSEKVADAVADGRHFLFAVKHPLRTLDALIREERKHLYLSHHISELRRMQYRGHPERQRANQMMQDIQRLARELRDSSVLFEPTTIDEARFDYRKQVGQSQFIVPKLGLRWPRPSEVEELVWVPPVDQLPELGAEWGVKADEILQKQRLSDGERAELALASALLQPLIEKIFSQINSRDHFLVEHAEGLVVYRPYLLGYEAGGVKEELLHHQRLISSGLARAHALVLHPPSDEEMRKRRMAASCFDGWWKSGELEGGGASDLGSLTRAILEEGSFWRGVDVDDTYATAQHIRRFAGQYNFRFRRAPSGSALEPAQPVSELYADEGRGRQFFAALSENYLETFRQAENTVVFSEELSAETFARRVTVELESVE